ncbi:hypothetical protein [Burkholderia diffusa]|uniref:hypothetical protein n=1 Tax=Burkholderia diffusa TaxID=488732 RepID=UPI001581BE65|nr:hypothetical protein [Burkholderia diffusa]
MKNLTTLSRLTAVAMGKEYLRLSKRLCRLMIGNGITALGTSIFSATRMASMLFQKSVNLTLLISRRPPTMRRY